MKGNISIGEFIHQVKRELQEAQNDNDSPFYELKEVELEVSFALETKGKGDVKLLVVELGGEVTAGQAHVVRLKLDPIRRAANISKQDIEPAGKIRKTVRATLPEPTGPTYNRPDSLPGQSSTDLGSILGPVYIAQEGMNGINLPTQTLTSTFDFSMHFNPNKNDGDKT